MLSALLERAAAAAPARPFLISGERELSYAAALEQVRAAAALAPRERHRVALRAAPEIQVILQALALESQGARLHLLPPELAPEVVEQLRGQVGFDWIAGQEDPVAPAQPVERSGELVIFTSGTTGLPKAALHTWETVLSRVRSAGDLEGTCWLLTYGLSSFAGLQVFLHALCNAGTLVLGRGGPGEMATDAARAQVEYVSGTPTFYRLMLATTPAATLDGWSPRQLTLGGEAVDQLVLDGLRARFPHARLTHIYASTELGVCFSVHDGRAGFPVDYLKNTALPAYLQVRSGELYIRSPHAMQSYLTGEPGGDTSDFPTGDLVEIRGDRVYFLGRRQERINVGGNKVYPREIELVVLQVPGVRAVQVDGAASSLVGQVVRARIVAEPEQDTVALRRSILGHCRQKLRPYQVPRLLKFVEALAINTSGKVKRT